MGTFMGGFMQGNGICAISSLLTKTNATQCVCDDSLMIRDLPRPDDDEDDEDEDDCFVCKEEDDDDNAEDVRV
jgi:hypothetical protein